MSSHVITRLSELADAELAAADAQLVADYPGTPLARQPVHSVYIPADRFGATSLQEWSDGALQLLDDVAPNAAQLASATGINPDEAEQVYDRVRTKLRTEPVEDLRVDFEDGYGIRSDAAEDADLDRTCAAFDSIDRPAWWGIRFKSFEAPTRARGIATLATFVERISRDGQLPEGVVLTLPKITSVDQVSALVRVLEQLEAEVGIPAQSLTFELQVETAQAVMASDGRAAIAQMIRAGHGRVTGMPYGTFDYSAGLDIAAPFQTPDHPVADHAKAVMQVAAAQTGVRVSDGGTNIVAFGDPASAAESWRLHMGLIDRSMRRGIYQGWDMCPGHLVSRYVATYVFFRRVLPSASARLAAYVQRISGDVLDEPATARMLSSALLRGIHCGAVDSEEVKQASGLTIDELADLTR